MEIHFHAIDFSVVDTDQQKYYDEMTKKLFSSQKNLRRLFDGVSDVILRRGKGFIVETCDNKPLPEYQDYLLVFDFPKNYFKEILLKLRRFLNDMEDNWCFNAAVDPTKYMSLYRNIKHLIITLAYQANIKGVCL